MRTIRALKDTIAFKEDDRTRTLSVNSGKIYPIELTLDRDLYWLITLGFSAGVWMFDKVHIEFNDDQLITYNQAQYIFKNSITKVLLNDLNDCMRAFKINTVARKRHFLAQIAHESVGLKYFEEIASGRAYEGRRDLGNIYPGDGVKFKGCGPIQVTGRTWHTKFSIRIGDPKVIELGTVYTAQKHPFSISGFWWEQNNMNALIDAGADVRQVTKKVNGGYNGLQDRIYYYNRACQVIK